MAYYKSEDGGLRTNIIEKNLKGFALKEYVLKTLLAVQKTTGWTSQFFVEEPTELTAKGTRKIRGLPRLAEFPVANVKYETKESVMEKYGLRGFVSWEDAMTDNVPIIARTLLRIGRAVVASTEGAIYLDLVSATGINTANTTAPWDGAGLSPVKDFLSCKRLITDNNYSADGITLVVNRYDYDMLVLYLIGLGANAPKLAEKALSGGKTMELAGIGDIMISDTIAVDKALIIKKGEAANWKELSPLTVFTKINEGIHYEIRAFEFGITEVVNPKQIVLLSNTRT